MKKNAGFTLIELMIVVEILGIIMAMAIPSYLRTRIQANEGAAVANMRAIMDAQLSYNLKHLSYAEDLSALTSAVPPFLNGDWEAPKSGYQFTLEGRADFFTISATPLEFGHQGWRGFYTDPSGIIRYALNAKADASSPPIGR